MLVCVSLHKYGYSYSQPYDIYLCADTWPYSYIQLATQPYTSYMTQSFYRLTHTNTHTHIHKAMLQLARVHSQFPSSYLENLMQDGGLIPLLIFKNDTNFVESFNFSIPFHKQLSWFQFRLLHSWQDTELLHYVDYTTCFKIISWFSLIHANDIFVQSSDPEFTYLATRYQQCFLKNMYNVQVTSR